MKVVTKVLAAMILTFALTSCGNSPQPKPSEITDEVLKVVDFVSPAEKSIDDLQYYIPLNTADIEDLSYYICGSGGAPDELLIVKFKSVDAVNSSLSEVQKKLDEKINTFKTYAPEEMYKLDSATVKSNNEYLIFYALSDNGKAGEIIDSFF